MIKFYKQQRKNLEEREMDISNSYNNNYRSGRMRNVKTSNSPLKNQRIIKNN